jgi:hypothetical protein
MITGDVVEPDAACTIPRPEADSFNVALRVVADGICDATRTTCFVPLDADTDEGWIQTEAGDRLQLPAAACEKKEEAGKVIAVYVSSACPTKFPGVPPCGRWSSVITPQQETPAPEDVAEQAPRPEIVASLSSQAGPLCCPLMPHDGQLYTCACPAPNDATVIRFDPARTNSQTVVTRLTPSATRQNTVLATTLVNGVLYWVRDRTLERTSLAGDMTYPAIALPATENVYEAAALQADQNAAYLWTFGEDAAANSVVRLLKVTNAGASQAFELGNASALQFAQDDAAVYVVTDVDARAAPGAAFARRSSVARIAKTNGARTTVLPERTLNTADAQRGGYIGVQVSGGKVFGLFESGVAQDGTRTLQLAAANAADGSGLQVLFETPFDDQRSRYTLLGVIDGNSVLGRFDSSMLNGVQSLVSSSMSVVPGSGAPARFFADFSREYPLQGLAVLADNFYWLNSSGKLFVLPVRTLR